MELCAVVMAAGEGKRMRSNHSKVVQLAAGKPLIRWVAEALSGVGATEQVYIVRSQHINGYGRLFGGMPFFFRRSKRSDA